MATHSSTLAWKIPWTEEPGGLQSMGSLRVGHSWVTSLSRIGEGNGNPLPCSFLENPRDGGAWWAAIYGVTQSRTRLKQLSSSSSRRDLYKKTSDIKRTFHARTGTIKDRNSKDLTQVEEFKKRWQDCKELYKVLTTWITMMVWSLT